MSGVEATDIDPQGDVILVWQSTDAIERYGHLGHCDATNADNVTGAFELTHTS